MDLTVRLSLMFKVVPSGERHFTHLREKREREVTNQLLVEQFDELQTTSSVHFEWSVLLASFIQSYKDGYYSCLLTTWKCVPSA